MKVIESEYHFILSCPKYRNLRQQYIGTIAWPSLHKFNRIMSQTDDITLYKLSKFIKEAMTLRKNYFDSILAEGSN